MEIFITCLKAVFPIFALIAIGYFCQKIGLIKRDDVPAMNSIAFNVFLTTVVFTSIYSSDLSETFNLRLVIFIVFANFIVFFGCVFYVRKFIPVENQRGVMIQGLSRSNSMLVGLQFASGLMGQQAMATIAMVAMFIIPMNNVFAVVTLSIHGAKYDNWGSIVIKVIKNPLIVASLAAVVLLLLDIQLPVLVTDLLESMSKVATPLMIFLLGAFFRFRSLRTYANRLIVACLGRLVIIPGIAIFAAYALGFTGIGMVAVIAYFATPTANASFTMVQQMGGDDELAGEIVAVTSAVCPFTLFAWCYALMTFGII